MIFFCCVLGVIPDLKETPKRAHYIQINYNTTLRAPTSRIPRVINMSVIENLINRVKLIKKKFKPIRDRNVQLKKQKKMFAKTRFPNDTALISEIESVLAFKIKKVNEIREELNSLETFLSHLHRIVPLQLTDLEWYKLRKQKRLKIIAHCIGLEKTILELLIRQIFY
ncbi:hypothetical protein TUBRATIS_16780 [Tubulinosema ratisbonensis]|uniref:Uncharacterized protein n=1 Tax=Tubulinosema ratisbonensis TaxID=291195 RepID=A0A437AKX8_9MICR|nr:hypothetical protein TUBRATIS_16780 [Tubulinosema ratisbonensis]